ncbi:MAG: pyridoxamine 5'-phosphate oxidase [Actinomycetales bacterium]|nr:MAG: pyridoxamine 5'-phosphate oxidase [Actinomycetales bacterium]
MIRAIAHSRAASRATIRPNFAITALSCDKSRTATRLGNVLWAPRPLVLAVDNLTSLDAVTERVNYTGAGLADDDLPDSPLELLSRWVADAQAAGAGGYESPEGLAMAFATVDSAGCPNVRTVLVRFLDRRGPGFVTDTTSTKAQEIDGNPQVAGSMGWPTMFRVVRFRGIAEPVEPEALAAYFTERPWGSRVSALASRQSEPVGARAELDALFEEYAARYPDTGSPDDVPVPDSWGGYRIRPWEVEFWAGRESRLHDRVVYSVAEAVGIGPAGCDDPAGWPLLDSAEWLRSRRMP